MRDCETEIYQIGELIRQRLILLKESGMSYIFNPKSNVEKNDNKVMRMNEIKCLDDLQTKLLDCQKCNLHKKRTNVVFGSGNPLASLVFVGEAPGAQEDEQGKPFVGRAGQLLTKMINAIGLDRKDVYICNVVKCRPPDNRDPQPIEILACEPFLKKQLSFIKPKVIVGLGRYACQTLLKEKTPMSKIRGTWRKYENVNFMPTFHPAYLLRNPPAKKEVWEDLRKVIKVLNN